jgi:hypothetical protein
VDALAAGGDQTVAFLEEQLPDPDLPRRDQEWARHLTAPLSDPDPQVRQRAVRELVQFGDDLDRVLRNAGTGPASRETLDNVEGILTKQLRYRRLYVAPQVLRQIATARARRLLARLADGPEENSEQAGFKRQARSLLEELDKLKVRRAEERAD